VGLVEEGGRGIGRAIALEDVLAIKKIIQP